MKTDDLQKIRLKDLGNDKPLADSVTATLVENGYQVAGSVQYKNYHQAFCSVLDDNGKQVGSAWQFSVTSDGVFLVGGREDELTSEASKKLGHAPSDFVYSLSPTSSSKNLAWRTACLENDKKLQHSFAAGSQVTISEDIGRKITLDGTPLTSMVIADGQRGLGYTPDGRRVRIPREMRKISSVSTDYPIITPGHIKSKKDRRIAATFMALDTVNNMPTSEFSVVIMRSKPPYDKEESNLLAFYSDDQIVGCIAGGESSRIAMDMFKSANLENGFTGDMVRHYAANAVEINTEKLEEFIEQAEVESSLAPTP